jgi:uncharacterized cupredoxin-like copper-binding protein
MAKRTLLVLVLFVLGLVATACGGGAEDPPATESAAGGVTTTEATEVASIDCDETTGKPDLTLAAVPTNGGYEYGWDQKDLKVEAGEEVVLAIENKSDTYHDFNAGACASGRIEKNETLVISFVAPEEAVEFVCSIHPETMVGTIEPK